MKKRSFLLTTAAVALLGFSPGAQARRLSEFSMPAVQPAPAVVTPGDTFNIAVAGFNTTDNTGVFLVSALSVTFTGTGVAQTFATAGPGGQTVSVTTTQTFSGSNVIDSIALSVPTNFVPSGTTTGSGAVINDIELDMGFNFAGTDTLSFTPAISGTPTYAGSILYATTSTLAITPMPTLTNNGTNSTLSYYEAVSTTATGGLSQFNIRTFNFSITYAVPEPSTYALCALGLVGFAFVVVRRRRQVLA